MTQIASTGLYSSTEQQKVGATSLKGNAPAFESGEEQKSQKTKDAPGLLLRMRKRSLSCNIASTIVYDTDLNTITQSAEIALERP
jgi:hypothetical protein